MNKKKSITKWALFVKTLPATQIVMIVIYACLWWFFSNNEILIVILIPLLMISVVTIIPHIYVVSIGFVRLKKQEQLLGFRFNDEMKKLGVTTTDFNNEEWYIKVQNFAHPSDHPVFIVYRNDFIKSINKRMVDMAGSGQSSRAELLIVGIDEKKQKIKVVLSTSFKNQSRDRKNRILSDFGGWHNKVIRKKSQPKRKHR